MAADKDDHDKTVFGGPTAGKQPSAASTGSPFPEWNVGQAPGGGDERTVIGGPGTPQQGAAPQGGSPFGQPSQPSYGQPPQGQGFGQPSYGQPPYGQPGAQPPAYGQPPFGQPSYGQPPQSPFGQPGGQGFGQANQSPFGQAPGGYGGPPPSAYGAPPYPPAPGAGPAFGAQGGSGQTWLGAPANPAQSIGQPHLQNPQGGMFPDYAHPQPQQQAHIGARISLDEALRVPDLGAASSTNPLLASAASLLILLGRLRTGLVELQVAPLMEHVTREIDRFERDAVQAGVAPHDALVAKYALSGTADDIVQNLPGSDRGNWHQYSMVARFFHKRDSGVGFFQEAEKAMQDPVRNYNLLELMLVCLSLGFEGQFRTMPNGGVELARIRNAIHETLRRVHPRPDEDISVTWQPVLQDRGRRFAAIPVPAIFGAAALVVVGVMATLLTLINREGAEAAETLRQLHRNVPVLQIDRSVETLPFVAENPQLERIREAFATEIAQGQVKVEPKGDFIAIRVGNLQLFDTGKFQVKDGFGALARRIAEVLNAEGGPILIEGHTDNVPMSGRGQFKNNYELSAARASAVAEVLAPLLGDASRVQAEGKGEDEPVADNAASEGQAENRRVEIMLAREGTYGAAAQGQVAAAPDPEPNPDAQRPAPEAAN